MTRNNSFKIILGIILFAAMVATVTLIGKRQELRRGAYFSTSRMLFQPDSLVSPSGVDKTVSVYVDTGDIKDTTTGEKAKVDFVQAQLCYGPELSLDPATLSSEITPGTGMDSIISSSVLPPQSGTNKTCVEFVAKTEKPAAQLQSGMVQVALIKFHTVSDGTGTIGFNKTRCQVSGYNPNQSSTDMAIEIQEFAELPYTIGNIASPTPTLACLPDGHICGISSQPGTACERCCNHVSYTETPGTIKCGTVGTITPTPSVYLTQTPTPGTPTATPTQIAPTLTPTLGVPTATPTMGQTTGKAVKFNMTYSGLVDPVTTMCSDNWSIKLLVMGGGQTAVYSNLVPVRQAGTNIYSVGTTLDGWTVSEGVAMFIKGPGHLQVKYGVSGQGSQYGAPGGSLSLVSLLDASTPVFDFTRYPVLGGDVVSDDGTATPDGRIDAVDFGALKALSQTTREITGHTNMDLDGNCQIGPNDLEVLKQSLKVKQSELY